MNNAVVSIIKSSVRRVSHRRVREIYLSCSNGAMIFCTMIIVTVNTTASAMLNGTPVYRLYGQSQSDRQGPGWQHQLQTLIGWRAHHRVGQDDSLESKSPEEEGFALNPAWSTTLLIGGSTENTHGHNQSRVARWGGHLRLQQNLGSPQLFAIWEHLDQTHGETPRTLNQYGLAGGLFVGWSNPSSNKPWISDSYFEVVSNKEGYPDQAAVFGKVSLENIFLQNAGLTLRAGLELAGQNHIAAWQDGYVEMRTVAKLFYKDFFSLQLWWRAAQENDHREVTPLGATLILALDGDLPR
jgi:hypothetical protein